MFRYSMFVARIAVFACVLLFCVSTADAETVAVITGDPALGGALDDALAPSGATVVVVVPPEAPPVPQLTARCRELAESHHAAQTIWLMDGAAGATLVAYDRSADRVLIRELPFTSPLSQAQAAEVARAARTMLRALRIPEPTAPTPPPVATTSTATTAARANAAVTVEPTPRGDLVDAGLLAEARADSPSDAAAAGVIVVVRPRGLGAAIRATAAASGDLGLLTFRGSTTDTIVHLDARYGASVAEHVLVAPSVGIALHGVHVTGMSDTFAADTWRFDPAVAIGVSAVVDVGHSIDAGVYVSADCLLRRQQFLVGDSDILTVGRVQFSGGLVITASLL